MRPAVDDEHPQRTSRSTCSDLHGPSKKGANSAAHQFPLTLESSKVLAICSKMGGSERYGKYGQFFFDNLDSATKTYVIGGIVVAFGLVWASTFCSWLALQEADRLPPASEPMVTRRGATGCQHRSLFASLLACALPRWCRPEVRLAHL
jgi:hypothetical protein